MKFSYEVSKHLERKLIKIKKKDKKRLEIVLKKMGEILNNPYHYKPLSHDMKGLRRVHIDKSFVLVYEVVENETKVVFLDLAHHDNIY